MHRGIVIGGIGLEQHCIPERGPFLPGRCLPDGGRPQAFGILDDASGIGVEQIAALDHVEHARGVPVEPTAGPIELYDRAERCDAAIHAVEVHGIDEIRPLERASRVVDDERGLAGCVGVAAGQRIVVRRERLDRLQARLRQGFQGRHTHALVVGLAGADHRCGHIAQLRQIPFTNSTARLHDGRDAPVQQIEQHLTELRARRVVGHRVGPDDHHGANDLLLHDLRTEACMGAAMKACGLQLLDSRLVLGRHGIAGEQHRFAVVAGAAVEPINGYSLGSGLEQQAVVVELALPRVRTQLHLRAMARDIHDLLDRQIMAVERNRLITHRRIARRVRSRGHCE